MPTDIIPQSAQNLHDWLENLLTKLPAQGPAAGLTAQETADFATLLQSIKTPVDAYLAAQTALDSASAALQQTLADKLPDVRAALRNLKGNPGYNDGIAPTSRSFPPPRTSTRRATNPSSPPPPSPATSASKAKNSARTASTSTCA